MNSYAWYMCFNLIFYFFRFCFLFPVDDTYMYDDAARGSIRPHQIGHWYDEPPYESDPDDFLMGINSGPAAIIQVCIISVWNLLWILYKLCSQSFSLLKVMIRVLGVLAVDFSIRFLDSLLKMSIHSFERISKSPQRIEKISSYGSIQIFRFLAKRSEGGYHNSSLNSFIKGF